MQVRLGVSSASLGQRFSLAGTMLRTRGLCVGLSVGGAVSWSCSQKSHRSVTGAGVFSSMSVSEHRTEHFPYKGQAVQDCVL